MSMSTYIVDDEQHAIDVIADYVLRTPGLTLSGSLRDPVKALAVLNSDTPPTLVFLDVDMPGLSGLELATLINGQTKVVFITSYREYGPEAFELNAVDYLLKPISYARFLKCVQKLQKESEISLLEDNPDFIYVKGNEKGKFVKISLPDVLYIKAELHYVDIHFFDETVTTYLTLSELEKKLPIRNFCRVHRSYSVNLQRIKAVEQSRIRLENKELIPIGRGTAMTF